jgi:hypothetical protein
MQIAMTQWFLKLSGIRSRKTSNERMVAGQRGSPELPGLVKLFQPPFVLVDDRKIFVLHAVVPSPVAGVAGSGVNAPPLMRARCARDSLGFWGTAGTPSIGDDFFSGRFIAPLGVPAATRPVFLISGYPTW